MPPLRPLNKLDSVNGDRTESNRVLKDLETPEEDRDATNKKWVTDNFVGV
jgi:hypothetical protein